ncbi:MAG: hypothetical protein M3362_20315, partial [Acidobacteriota bacterium]|nr:hypothetical protein [Acidobacteriota bacterium]
ALRVVKPLDLTGYSRHNKRILLTIRKSKGEKSFFEAFSRRLKVNACEPDALSLWGARTDYTQPTKKPARARSGTVLTTALNNTYRTAKN